MGGVSGVAHDYGEAIEDPVGGRRSCDAESVHGPEARS
jgi:hypothetical protein